MYRITEHELSTRSITFVTTVHRLPLELRACGSADPTALIRETSSHDHCKSLLSLPTASREDTASNGRGQSRGINHLRVFARCIHCSDNAHRPFNVQLIPRLHTPSSEPHPQQAQSEGEIVVVSDRDIDQRREFARPNSPRFSSSLPCLTRVCHPAFVAPPFKQQVKV